MQNTRFAQIQQGFPQNQIGFDGNLEKSPVENRRWILTKHTKKWKIAFPCGKLATGMTAHFIPKRNAILRFYATFAREMAVAVWDGNAAFAVFVPDLKLHDCFLSVFVVK